MSEEPATPSGFFGALRFPAYRRLWFGAFTSSLGTWTQDVALAWLIHEQLKNPVYLGLRQFAAEAPLLAFMLIGGAMADRIDRRKILLGSQFVQMALAGTLAGLYFAGQLGLLPILLIAFGTGLAQSQSAPTYQAVLSTLVPKAQIPNAIALNSLQFNLSRTLGPALAGVLLAWVGAGFCFSANALSFLAVIAALWRIEIPSPATAANESLRQSLVSGLRHVWDDPLLRTLVLLGFGVSLLGFPLLTYLPVLAGDVLATGALGFSLLLSGFGGGAIVGALVTAYRGRVPGRGRTALVALGCYGLIVFAAVRSGSQAQATVLLFAAGVALSSGFSILNSLVQEQAPEDLRGRIVSIYGLAFRGGMPIGSLVAGFLVKAHGVPVVIGVFSLCVALLAGATLATSARLRCL